MRFNAFNTASIKHKLPHIYVNVGSASNCPRRLWVHQDDPGRKTFVKPLEALTQSLTDMVTILYFRRKYNTGMKFNIDFGVTAVSEKTWPFPQRNPFPNMQRMKMSLDPESYNAHFSLFFSSKMMNYQIVSLKYLYKLDL